MATVVANGHTTDAPKTSSRKKSPATAPAVPATTAPVAAPAAPAARTRKTKTQAVDAAPVAVVAPPAPAPAPVVAAPAEKKGRSRKTAAQPPAAAPAAAATPAAPAEKKTRAKSQPKAAQPAPVEEKKGRSRKGAAQPAAQPAATSEQKAAEPKPRAIKEHPNVFATEGIITATSRVRDYLDSIINAKHEEIVAAIRAGHNKPKPLTDKDGNKLPPPPQGPQVPVSKLAPAVVKMINEAEAQYKQRLVEKYERYIVEKLKEKDEKKYEAYITARDKEMKAAKQRNEEFNLHNFNETYNPKFYADLNNFIKNDILTIGHVHPKAQNSRCPDEWTRAIAVVNKTRVHFAKSTKVILAGFLDNIPRQLITNGIANILQANRSQVKLEFCLNQLPGYEKRLTLLPFLRTLSVYDTITKWVHSCYEITQFNAAQKDKEQRKELPERPEIPHGEIFKQSVGTVFNSVRAEMIQKESDEEKKKQLQMLKFSEDTRYFCSGLIYEAISRIAVALGRRIGQEEKKTLRLSSVENIIMEMLDLLGITDAENIMNDIRARREVFDKAAASRKQSKPADGNGQVNNAEQKLEDELEYEN